MSGRASTAAASDSERDLTALHEHMAATHGVEPYPQFTPTHSMAAFIAEWEDALEPGARVDNVEVRIAGRVTAKRDASNKLVFYDLSGPIGPDGETHTVQLMAARNRYEGPATASGTQSEQALHAEFSLVNHALRRGDVIGVRGLPGKSKKGQLSVLPVEISLLSPCLPNLPDTKGEGGSERLKDKEARHRQRYLDLLVNGSSREVFAKRSAVSRRRVWRTGLCGNAQSQRQQRSQVLRIPPAPPIPSPYRTILNQVCQHPTGRCVDRRGEQRAAACRSHLVWASTAPPATHATHASRAGIRGPRSDALLPRR